MNRIKELRKANHMTQAELAEKLGVTPQAVGAYERGDRGVNRETLEKLSEIFSRSAGYIAGEPSEDNVIRYLMGYYNEPEHVRLLEQVRNFPLSLWVSLETYFVGNGIVPYNRQSDHNLLREDQAYDFNFWKEKFGWLNDQEKFKYLKDNCEAVPESTFEIMLATVIAASYSKKLLPNVHYKSKDNKEWVDEDSDFRQRLVKRQKFLRANLVRNTEPDFIDPYGKRHYDWSFTWELGLPVEDID